MQHLEGMMIYVLVYEELSEGIEGVVTLLIRRNLLSDADPDEVGSTNDGT